MPGARQHAKAVCQRGSNRLYPSISWLRVSYFSVPVLNDITNIEDKHSTRGNEQRLAQSDLAQKLRGNSERKYDHSKHLQRATDPVA